MVLRWCNLLWQHQKFRVVHHYQEHHRDQENQKDQEDPLVLRGKNEDSLHRHIELLNACYDQRWKKKEKGKKKRKKKKR